MMGFVCLNPGPSKRSNGNSRLAPNAGPTAEDTSVGMAWAVVWDAEQGGKATQTIVLTTEPEPGVPRSALLRRPAPAYPARQLCEPKP